MTPFAHRPAIVALLVATCLLVPNLAVAQVGLPSRPPVGPRWYKGNLHTHSLWSDGGDFPEVIADWYAREGYHFLSLSDHNIIGRGEKWVEVFEVSRRGGKEALARYRRRFGDAWVETRTDGPHTYVRIKPLGEYRTRFERPGRFLFLQGEEITDQVGPKPIHLTSTNLRELVRPQGGSTALEAISHNLAAVAEQAAATGQPALTHVNHPNFHFAITAEELATTPARFVEIYNGHPETHQVGDAEHAGVERVWDIANTIRLGEMGAPPLFGVAVDDAHHYHNGGHLTPGRGWIMVRARFLTPKHLLEAIAAGDYYASTGVTLREVHYAAEARTLTVEVEPRGDTKYTTRFIGTFKGHDPTRQPVRDAIGKPLPVTGRYSDEVGQVLATVEGTRASYPLTGAELYVRAVVTADRPPPNPSFTDQKAQAWTQPVGWDRWVAPDHRPEPAPREAPPVRSDGPR